jgi:Asp-tRNA(Asn)/Glu-tRNA(Gln) amidotransferase A subunit family amidase
LAVPEGPLLERVEPDALRAFREAADGLRARGFGIVEARVLDDLESVRELHEALTASDMAAAHAAWHPRFADLYGERTRRLIERGRDVPAAQVAAAHASMASLRARLDGYLRERRLDGFLCPSAPGTAPLGLSSTGDPIMNLPWTHAGLPVVSLPSAGLHGLPLGLQVAGRFGGDEELLGLCARLAESVTYL